ncbi:hypothetical protein G7Y89_g3892 [Cudoniella acicularis]|uniref:Uncharacterized protein n=1 Tax=Cudoniella acicularis TaxID=354080 RepID=A0A8H4RSF1_9HELO|nr:hypothetical protein G7Y89_g3892 [Cudoniella acicularis]
MQSNFTSFESHQDSFSPIAQGHFDFTPIFENSILSILPSAILLLIIPFRLGSLFKKSPKVSRSLLRWNKLQALLVVFTILQGTILGLYAAEPTIGTPTALTAASLVFADAIGLCLLSQLEHIRSIKPSLIIDTYLFITLLFDAAHTRTLWIAGAPRAVTVAFSTSTVLKLVITIVEAVEKRNILLPGFEYSSPEATSGIYSRSFFWWLNSLMRNGFHGVLEQKDLFSSEDGMSSSTLQGRSQISWNNANKNRSHALFWSTLKATRHQFVICVFPRLCLVGFRYAQPFLLSRTVNFVNSETESDNIGWGLTGAFGVVFLGMAVSGGSYNHMACRFITSVRGSLVAMVYTKTVDLSITSLDDSAAITLMSNDAVKMLGFSDKLTEILQGLRVKELRISNLFRRLLCVRVFFANSMRTLTPLVTLGFFVLATKLTGRELNTATAYTTLSLIGLLANPVNTLLRTITMFHSALACFGRIQSFLESDSRQHHILPLTATSGTRKDRTMHTDSEVIMERDGDFELENLNQKGQRQSDSLLLDVRNASFAWKFDGHPAVQDVSFSIHRGGFTLIIGPVGCGKTTLLKGLMSETPSLKGFVYSNTSEIGYVDQSPWIQNTTILQNITCQSRFNESWYNEVVRACALDYDIEALPNGNATLVGSRGISLSGGQKQRLAIARAVYAKKDLVIIDDGFSGLDVETEEKVFSRLFSEQGLLRRLGTTVILVTHGVHRLSYADHIVALDTTGHVSEQGSFELLQRSGGYVEGLTTKHKHDNAPNSEESDLENPSTAPQTIPAKNRPKDEVTVMPNGELSTYKYYFASIGWSRSMISLFYLLLSGVALKLTELVLTFWTSAAATRGNEVDSFYLGLYGMLAGLGVITYTIGVYHYFLYVVPGSAEELHARLLRAVMDAPLSFFASTDTGTTTNRFSQDMSIVDGELPFALIDLIGSLVQTLMGAILMCLSAGYFTLTMPPVAFVVWVIQKFYIRTSRQIRILDLEAKSPLYSHFIESLSGLVTIRAFGWTDQFIEQNLTLLDESQKPYYLLFCIQRWLSLVLDIMVSVLAIILMVLVVKLRSTISPGFVGLALLNVMGFSQSLAWNVRQWTALETSIGAISRLKTFAELTPNENLPNENQPVPDIWPSQGAIELKNVSASYQASGDLVIYGINMSIKAGEKIGICGRSGSGKSSLILTLFRMLEVSDGSSITVDGIDITTIPRQLVRSRFNAIPQEPFFMKGSIRLNASPENLHNDTEIIEALQKVQLWSVVERKGGLDAELDAEFFSHGQRQLFCLGRTILRKSKIVVLDEVSSSMDGATDKVIQQVIREEFSGATIIAVAHRLDTILDFDRIAVMSDGKLVEFESPEVLLGRQSVFRELYNS